MKKVVTAAILLGWIVAGSGCGSGSSAVVEYNAAMQAWDRNDKMHVEVVSTLKNLNKDHPEYRRLVEKEAELSRTQEKLRERIDALKSQL